jgi:hypothetical protein
MTPILPCPASGWGGAHAPLTVYRRRLRDLWRRTYWVVCCHCDLRRGPYGAATAAYVEADVSFGATFFDIHKEK